MGSRQMEEKRPNLFKEAVERTPDIQNGYRIGLKALKGKDAGCVTAENTRMVDGSVDVDACTRDLYPNEARWDYVVGYRGCAYFLEVHPAHTCNVKEMIKKAEWLRNWLTMQAPALKTLQNGKSLYWVPSGKHNILPNSPQSRMLAQSHILLVGKLKLSE